MAKISIAYTALTAPTADVAQQICAIFVPTNAAADNAAQTVALEQYLNPVPVPAYMVQNPRCGCAYGI